MNISIMGYKVSVEILVMIVVIYFLMIGHTLFSCANCTLAEGLEVIKEKKIKDAVKETKEALTMYSSTAYDLAGRDQDAAALSNRWSNKNIQAVDKKLDYEPQPVPLPEGEMLLFATTKFAPEYCPGTYTTSQGCAAITDEQYKYLVERGGNNI